MLFDIDIDGSPPIIYLAKLIVSAVRICISKDKLFPIPPVLILISVILPITMVTSVIYSVRFVFIARDTPVLWAIFLSCLYLLLQCC